MIEQALITTKNGKELLLHAFCFSLSTQTITWTGINGFMTSKEISEELEAKFKPVTAASAAVILQLELKDLIGSSVHLLDRDWVIRDFLISGHSPVEMTCWRPLSPLPSRPRHPRP